MLSIQLANSRSAPLVPTMYTLESLVSAAISAMWSALCLWGRQGLPPDYAQGLSLCCRRVHISQSTMDCLKGEFDVEPGDGGSRCDYLDEKGIETYLIIASKPEVKKTAQNGLNGSVSLPSNLSPIPSQRGGMKGI